MLGWGALRLAVAIAAAGGATAGCGRGTITPWTTGARAADYSPADRLRVMLPAGADQAAGQAVSARVVEVLQQTHADVAVVPTADPSAALAAARRDKATYLVAPVILEWADGHAPPLSADRVGVRLELRDVAANETVSAVTFENASSLIAVSDTPPEVLLDDNFDRAVTMLITTGTGPGAEPTRVRRPRSPDPESMDARKYPRQ
jgi:hypothetical protein